MKVIFVKSKSISSYLIRLFTWSSYHHCGILVGNKVIEAQAKKGVVEVPFDDFVFRYEDYKIVEVPANQDWLFRAKSQLGKSYDWMAIFSLIFRGNWAHKDKWFCSELVAYASGVFREDLLKRITPQGIYKIGKDVR